MSKPTNFSVRESLDVVWEALHGYHDVYIMDSDQPEREEEWNDICLAMAWIQEALGVDDHA